MRSVYLSNVGPLLALAMALAAPVACSPATSSTTATTAADVENAAATASAKESPAEAAERTDAEAKAPEARTTAPVCRTKSAATGTTELVLTWSGDAARGSLEQTAPSGHQSSQLVKAERHKTMIVADHLTETDLVSHVAVVAEKNGKRYMRVGDDAQPWLPCE